MHHLSSFIPQNQLNKVLKIKESFLETLRSTGSARVRLLLSVFNHNMNGYLKETKRYFKYLVTISSPEGLKSKIELNN